MGTLIWLVGALLIASKLVNLDVIFEDLKGGSPDKDLIKRPISKLWLVIAACWIYLLVC